MTEAPAKTLVLASASSARARLLRAAGVPLRVVPTDLPEAELRDALRAAGSGPGEAAARLADAKALALAGRVAPDDLVLGADQILEFEGEWLEKCPDLGAAAALLRRLRGRTHRLWTAAVLVRGEIPLWRHVETVELRMRAFSDAFLAEYLERSGASILSAVGAYRLEECGVQLFSRIQGDYFSILGLPLLPLLEALRQQRLLEP